MEKPLVAQKPWFDDLGSAWARAKEESGWEANK